MGSPKLDNNIAVFFMEDHQVVRQMLFSEFEAFLDGYVGLSDMADREVRGVYAVINSQLNIESLVFFLIYFDDEGRADPGWNVPVEQFANTSGRGPDLGGGSIRLACRSQCPVDGHQKELWDPDMTPSSNHFASIRRAASANRLGFKVVPVQEEIPTLKPDTTVSEAIPTVTVSAVEDEASHRIKLARLIKNQRLRIKTLESQRESEREALLREHRLDSQGFKSTIQELSQSVEKLKVINEQLQEKLFSRNEQYLGLQDKVSTQTSHLADLEDKLKNAEAAERDAIEKQKLEAELVIMKEQLDRRDIESVYREEKAEQLRAELDELKVAYEESQEDSMMTKLKDLEVVFVAYHPGAGHVTIPFSDIVRYTDNPVGYVASKCYVTEECYQNWLNHQESLICGYQSENGVICGQQLEAVSNPSEFEIGISDRCRRHQGEG